MGEMGKGRLLGPDLEKTSFADLVEMIRDDYAVNQRRSVRRLNTSLKVLEAAFSHLRACDLTLDRLNRYVSDRLAAGIAPATVKLENPEALETIGPDLPSSFRSQSLTEESAVREEPVKPDRAR